ncbi:hypothetical protein VTL71DRAFT_8141, partial [Oculimacula yallundae]
MFMLSQSLKREGEVEKEMTTRIPRSLRENSSVVEGGQRCACCFPSTPRHRRRHHGQVSRDFERFGRGKDLGSVGSCEHEADGLAAQALLDVGLILEMPS